MNKGQEPHRGAPTSRPDTAPLASAPMADSLSRDERSKRMSLIRGSDTKLELRFRRALHASGVRGWRCHVRGVFGVPDLAWQGRKLAVFIDSAWWHGHPSRWKPGKLPGRWDDKIRRNKERDAEVTSRLTADGWTVLRFWDFEIERELDRCVEEVKAAVRGRRGRTR